MFIKKLDEVDVRFANLSLYLLLIIDIRREANPERFGILQWQ